MNNWLDTRMKTPPTTRYDKYVVAFKCSYTNSLILGKAGWLPQNNYTEGSWVDLTHTNGNPTEGEILYWIPYPKLPELK